MTLSRVQTFALQCADKTGKINEWSRFVCTGIHFCPDWDFLPVCDDSPEKESCLCELNGKMPQLEYRPCKVIQFPKECHDHIK